DDETFSVDVDDPRPSSASFQPVIEALQDPSRKEEAIDALIDVCRDVVEDERTKKGANAALKAVTAAYARLADVNLGAAEPNTYDAIDKQLDQIAERTTGLKSVLTKLRNAK